MKKLRPPPPKKKVCSMAVVWILNSWVVDSKYFIHDCDIYVPLCFTFVISVSSDNNNNDNNNSDYKKVLYLLLFDVAVVREVQNLFTCIKFWQPLRLLYICSKLINITSCATCSLVNALGSHQFERDSNTGVGMSDNTWSPDGTSVFCLFLLHRKITDRKISICVNERILWKVL